MPGVRRPLGADVRAFAVTAAAGCLVGLVGGGFRWCLERADALRRTLLTAAAELGAAAVPVPIALTASGALVARLIALGALWGTLVHALTAPVLPSPAPGPAAFAVVGMAALFTGVVRAPVTGSSWSRR
ncbi:chloride channel protein [Streptomyces lavendulae]|uniref:chloride channel protein n=1 Tax=Streptomyces lavendulae TaxID=1914 RepID=UPI00340DA635